MKILITGGTGYIGSHTAVMLLRAGHEVTVIDNLFNSDESVLDKITELGGKFNFIKRDLLEFDLLKTDFDLYPTLESGFKFDACIHFAALIEVGVSVQKPGEFFSNNVVGSQNLFRVIVEKKLTDKLIFSSTAAVYGTPESIPIKETDQINTENPYGTSKYVTEKILEDYCKFTGLNALALRYFNPAGSLEGKLGEEHKNESHLIPRLLKSYLDPNMKFGIYGDDFQTPDGTCIRDYIHILDLVDAHIKAIEYIKQYSGFDVFNIGTGKGYSVAEVVNMSKKITGINKDFPIHPRRAGDSAMLVADATKINQLMGWQAKYGLEDIVKSAWEFIKNN